MGSPCLQQLQGEEPESWVPGQDWGLWPRLLVKSLAVEKGIKGSGALSITGIIPPEGSKLAGAV